jgi:hypothetical protein
MLPALVLALLVVPGNGAAFKGKGKDTYLFKGEDSQVTDLEEADFREETSYVFGRGTRCRSRTLLILIMQSCDRLHT